MSNDNPKWERYGQIRLSPEPDDFQVDIYKDSKESEQWFLTCKDLGIEKKWLTEIDEDKAKIEALNIVSVKLDVAIEKFRLVREFLDKLKDDRDAGMRYREAIAAGATEVLLPASVEKTGYAYISCCKPTQFGQYPSDDRVELTMYEWTVYTCPRCGKVWALRIEQPEEVNNDDH